MHTDRNKEAAPSTVGKLNAQFRAATGKTNVRRLRAAGQIPAVIYGGAAEPFGITLDPKALLRALDPAKKTNTLIQLKISGTPSGEQDLLVMVRDHQKDALRGDLTHADFVRVQADKDVHAVVPIVLTGRAEGVKAGGIMHQVLHRLEIACTPDRIPIKIEVDISALNMNEALHVSDLKLSQGVKARAASGQTVCAVTAPRAEKVEVAAEVDPAVAAAAAPAADAKGAAAAGKDAKAPAGGKDAKAAPAAKGAPAAKEDKKK
jgi:large subunit ribosomal protein L25